jgi:hypothetical protein
LLVIWRLPPAVNFVRLVGFAQPISSAICFERPITVAVEQLEVT